MSAAAPGAGGSGSATMVTPDMITAQENLCTSTASDINTQVNTVVSNIEALITSAFKGSAGAAYGNAADEVQSNLSALTNSLTSLATQMQNASNQVVGGDADAASSISSAYQPVSGNVSNVLAGQS